MVLQQAGSPLLPGSGVPGIARHLRASGRHGGLTQKRRIRCGAYTRPMDRDGIFEHISSLRRTTRQPLIVGISGYAGSGKSTLARFLAESLPGAVRLRGDDFLDPCRSHQRSSDWDGVDRTRLVTEVLDPLRQERPGTFRRFDWSTRSLADPEPLPRTDLLIVDLIGLFHPHALPHLDIRIWCDVELDVAARRGIARDRALGRDHEALWHDVWIPNERDFDRHHTPRERAEILFEASSASHRRPSEASPPDSATIEPSKRSRP
ncbi:uridine kinase family protein [Brachybacterium alimentarium]|uniref:uridine kinase family protein n=1 Tax=Brachybacterium alimentarium TaxID=47845 RepID=UPI003FD1DF58